MHVVTELLADKRKLKLATESLTKLRALTYHAACSYRNSATMSEVWQEVCKCLDRIKS